MEQMGTKLQSMQKKSFEKQGVIHLYVKKIICLRTLRITARTVIILKEGKRNSNASQI